MAVAMFIQYLSLEGEFYIKHEKNIFNLKIKVYGVFFQFQKNSECVNKYLKIVRRSYG